MRGLSRGAAQQILLIALSLVSLYPLWFIGDCPKIGGVRRQPLLAGANRWWA
jgi:hypothetical protein